MNNSMKYRDDSAYTIKSMTDVDYTKHDEHWFQTGVNVYAHHNPPVPLMEFDFVGEQGTKIIRIYTEKGLVPKNAKLVCASNYPNVIPGLLAVPILGGGLTAGYAFFK